MDTKVKIFFILLIKVNLIFNTYGQEVLGCGGFIKSQMKLDDFSKIEIKLLTKQGGSVKDKTDCSPSNGYYFIPIYDKGEYILKVSPPPGWSFEPDSIAINFDGKTDPCSLGEDVNFMFKGFGITGKIGVFGQTFGAGSIHVELKSTKDAEVVRQTVSDGNGVFQFTPVIPGQYILKASHPSWSFIKSEYTVMVQTGNTELPKDSLLVFAFDVRGKVVFDGVSFSDAGVLLFTEKGVDQEIISKYSTAPECNKKNVPVAFLTDNPKYERTPICYLLTTKTGEYVFSSVPPGHYLIKTHFQNKNIKYHVKPDNIEVKVIKEGVVIKDNFEITGLSVSGRVLASQNGLGIPYAKIKLNGVVVTSTFLNGSYVLENIKAGTFLIQASADNVEFSDYTVKITPTNPSIPDIIVSSFKVCGQVVSQQSHKVAITKHSSTFHTETFSKPVTGEWCVFLPNGEYSVEVVLSDEHRSNGVQFFPITQNIEVISGSKSGIIFSQLRATVSGEVKCLSDADASCKQIIITMNALDVSGGQYITADLKNSKYSFSDILPGNYEVIVPQSHLCWNEASFKINVKSSEETIQTFVQTGYLISIISSHSTEMSYKQKGEHSTWKKIELKSGLTRFCVPHAGVYDIKLSGCHSYDTQITPKTFSTKYNGPISITAFKHKNGIRILSEEKTNYKIAVEWKSERKPTEIISLVEESNKVDGYFSYKYFMNLKNEETIKLSPKSSDMLFKPEFKEVTGGDDCVDVTFSFIATKGLVINGKIDPPISGVKVTLSFPRNPELDVLVSSSNPKGEFRFGPVDGNIDVEISAEKESYIFSEYDKNTNLFKALKLCEIIVTVKDEQNNKLPGVLLSLSGGESYRKNLITSDDGTIKFHSLSPSQYYLRPMMKEYKFEPTSKMIDVKEGATVKVNLSGRRVAFSAFGQVTSLNGEPFVNVVVEAIAKHPCPEHQEESSTENNGQYRIRGLQPGCQYDIRIRDGNINPHVDRSIPSVTSIDIQEDVRDINIIAISPLGFVDVITKIMCSHNDHYKTLRIQLYKKGNVDSPIYSQRVESPLNVKSKINPGIMVFFPRIPLDGKIYFVEITTTLSDKNFKYTLPSYQFIANTSSVFFELNFNPEVRTSESDLNQNSISALILIGIIAIVFYRQDLVIDYLNQFCNIANSHIQTALNSNKRKREANKYDTIDDNEIEQLAQSINSVKKKKSRKVN